MLLLLLPGSSAVFNVVSLQFLFFFYRTTFGDKWCRILLFSTLYTNHNFGWVFEAMLFWFGLAQYWHPIPTMPAGVDDRLHANLCLLSCSWCNQWCVQVERYNTVDVWHLWNKFSKAYIMGGHSRYIELQM